MAVGQVDTANMSVGQVDIVLVAVHVGQVDRARVAGGQITSD